MSRHSIEEWAGAQHERLADQFAAGLISQDEYNSLAADIDHEAREAIGEEAALRHQEIEEEYYGW